MTLAHQAGETAVPLWGAVVPDLARRVRPLAGTLIRDAVVAIQEAVPQYRRPLSGKFREVLVGAVRAAVLQCFEFIEDPAASRAQWLAVLRHAGRVEFHEGRTLDALQTAVRVGARSVWRHISAAGQDLGIEADTLLAVAEAIFAYVDDLCVVAAAGYTEARAAAGGAHDQCRKRLLHALLTDQPANPHAITDLAAAADWPLPPTLCVVLLDEPTDRLPAGALVDLDRPDPCLIIAAPVADVPASAIASRAGVDTGADHRPTQIDLGSVRGPADWAARVVIGPAVAVHDVHRSLRSARRAQTLVHRGVLPDGPVTWCDEHLATLLLFTDESLVHQVARPVVAALAGLTDKQRGRIAETLRTWLHTRGDIGETAALLAVHPQTVRYRMNHVEALLGDRLADPEQRFLMELTAHVWSGTGDAPA
ncbi:PucR family transcriptional regulator [Actinokineospora diospyrosa]|uniref:PucR C-terminal helix-turn-helix domain-containing protein n=1 Tax=Actinokineospora diospyrosa TaxID=103728 RepID=A0ABT1INP7_9PSEU|nr:helix-turn-helix domain-containing protein [Actinokineospora diospyrosa]MCP2274301.1 PucR C-terminal helix-turn-helix domain-containing protein [Actinokineospora diospyrosa]